MEWIIVFAVSWILFFVLVDWKQLKVNIWSGIMAAALQMAVDTHAMQHGYYKVENGVVQVLGSSLFFVLGPVLTIGILLAQFHPVKKRLVILHVSILIILFSVQELFLLDRGALVYENWHTLDSLGVNLMAIATLSWFSITVLRKMECDSA